MELKTKINKSFRIHRLLHKGNRRNWLESVLSPTRAAAANQHHHRTTLVPNESRHQWIRQLHRSTGTSSRLLNRLAIASANATRILSRVDTHKRRNDQP
jgi:hypothetical protein